jgi:glycine cleavage system H protein
MTTPQDLRYSPSHEWIRDEGDGTATVGITHHAQDKLGDVVFWEGPKAGAKVTKGRSLGLVESVKATSDVYAPVSGEVIANNDALSDDPSKVNADPYGAGWMVRLRISDPSELAALLDAAAYAAHVAKVD